MHRMRHRYLLIALLLLVPRISNADVVKLAWDPAAADTPPPEGYRVVFGTTSGGYTSSVDVGLVTTAQVVLPLPQTHYFLAVVAYIGSQTSGFSNEVSTTTAVPVDHSCDFPLGNRSVSIFPTYLQKTGSGGAGSRARLDFQLGSPNSPITRVSIKTNGVDLSVMGGVDLTALAGMWFTVPAGAGTYPLAISATNVYGCSREQPTSFSVTVK